MNEQKIKENIKTLTVQIVTPQEKGTGVLINYNNRPSILTVHHCIYGKNKSHNIEADEVKIIFYNKAEYYAIDIEVIGELVILGLDSKEFNINYPIVEFLEVEYEQNYHIRGFPSGLDKAHNFSAKCNDIERKTFQIEIKNMTSDTSGEDAIEYMRGVSGSGVFFTKDKKLYLVGLVNALANQAGTFNAVSCLNLNKLFQKSNSKKSLSFNYLWLGLAFILGTLAVLSYSNTSETEVLAPKSILEKHTTSLKPLIPSEKRAVLDMKRSEFSSMIESKLAQKFSLVKDELLANYIIKITSKIRQKESTVYGETIIKSDCELNLKIIELQNQENINSKFYNATATGFDKESSANSCFSKMLLKLDRLTL